MRTVRVPCSSCTEGYYVGWHRWNGKLFYRCVACEAELAAHAHRWRKKTIVEYLGDGEPAPRHFVVDPQTRQAELRCADSDVSLFKPRRQAAPPTRSALSAEEIAALRVRFANRPNKLRVIDFLEKLEDPNWKLGS